MGEDEREGNGRRKGEGEGKRRIRDEMQDKGDVKQKLAELPI